MNLSLVPGVTKRVSSHDGGYHAECHTQINWVRFVDFVCCTTLLANALHRQSSNFLLGCENFYLGLAVGLLSLE